MIVGRFATLAAATALAATATAGSGQQRLPTPEDLLGFTDVTTVELAPDGHALLFVTTERDPETDRSPRAVWHTAVLDGSVARVGEELGARSPAWTPDGRISFLATEQGATRLFTLRTPDDSPRAILTHDGPILGYAWSSDGRRIAFTALGEGDGFEADSREAERGIVVSKWDFIFYRLYGNVTFATVQRPVELWIHDVDAGSTERISGERSVSGFAWSPVGAELAIVAAPQAGMGVVRSDLLLYSADQKTWATLLEGHDGDGYTGGLGYSQPVWSPDGARLVVQRSERGGDTGGPDLVVYHISSGELRSITDSDSLDLYSPTLWWLDDEEIFVEMHYHGQRGLFSLSARDGSIRPLRHEADLAEGFAFSADGRRAAWIGQSTASPPEVSVADWPFTDPQTVTALNERYDSIWLPRAEVVRWRSTDGTEVSGLLLKPHGYREGTRYPLVTLVHGGPVFAVIDRFRLYPAWEYAGQVLAARGYAVFYPNYRGTGSYGPAFRRTTGPEVEPVQDVLTGVRHLIDRGIADEERLGIVGQSYGAWVGPFVVIREPSLFRAASFAEGMVDYITAYMLVPGWHMLRSYEPDVGNPFQHTQRYVELSPMFHLGGTATPTMIEAGQQSLPTQGLRYASALWRHGIPHELVIYPATGHNITSPALTLDSVDRNLDWLDFWILDRRNPDPAKADRYRRWEAIRAGEGFPPPLEPAS